MQKGDLVYIPSETNIYKLASEIEDSTIIRRTSKLQEPKSFLLLEVGSECYYLKILVGGEEWYVKAEDAKKIENWEN